MVITGSNDRDHARLTFYVGLGKVVWSSVSGRTGPFFCSTRAASILPSRPRLSQPARAGSIKAGRVLAATRQGLALTGPSTTAPIVADRLSRRTAEIGECANVRSDPVRQALREARFRVGVIAGAEHGDENLHGEHFAGEGVDHLHGVTGIIDEQLVAGDVNLAQA
jgi:hypothetical protein